MGEIMLEPHKTFKALPSYQVGKVGADGFPDL
jgi:hypothetical protein